jgi:hypothetical protein
MQKTQDLQGPFVPQSGLQTSLPASLHGLHLSCNENQGLQKLQLIENSYLSYGNLEIVWRSLCNLEVIVNPAGRLWM